MSFDFKLALAAAKEVKQNNLLGLIVLGASGSGKSTLIGTSGLKTLLLYTRGENHAVQASRTYGKDNIISVCLDLDDAGNVLNASQALKKLHDILDSAEDIQAAGFKVVALDSSTELESLIRNSNTFSALVGNNSFKSAEIMSDMLRTTILKLSDLQRRIGVHYIVTCALDIKQLGDNGEIMESQPKLMFYRAAESLVQLFPDVATIGAMTNGEVVSHRLQFLSTVSRDQKDTAGGIKKTLNFKPRLSGIDLTTAIPEHGTLPADLAQLIQIKQGKAPK